MRIPLTKHYPLIAVAVAAALLLPAMGCSRNASWSDRREEQNPLVKRARVRKKTQDIDGAIELYNKALSRSPALARAHLEVGLLYEGYREDYIRAIYHYQRYLELRPDTEKKDMIQDLVRRARISFAASLPDTPPGAIEEIKELKEEVALLKSKLADARGSQKRPTRVSQVKPSEAKPASPPVVEPTRPPAPAPAQGAVQTYRVQRGDTLSSIAAKMYDDPTKWKKVYESNRSTLKRPESLRVGQMLIIPR